MSKENKRSCRAPAGPPAGSHHTFPLLSLPVDLRLLVLAQLRPRDLQTLMVCSKTMAQQVMQHSAGRLEIQVAARRLRRWAGVRRLLSWMPRACMKLRLQCPNADHMASKAAMRGLFTAPDRVQMECLTHIRFKGLELPWFIPPGLADTCPNVHTLCLDSCRIELSTRNKACTKAAASIQHLTLTDTRIYPQWLDGLLPGEDVPRNWRSVQPYLMQLKASLPNLKYLWISWCCHQVITLWASQLTEVHAEYTNSRLYRPFKQFTPQLSQLRKLVAPLLLVRQACQLRALLSLPVLTHLEVLGFWSITEDLSSHACTWQHLALHLSDLPWVAEDMSHVPLHSLMTAVVLHTEGHMLTVELPLTASTASVRRLQMLSQKLGQCGVQTDAEEVRYAPHYPRDDPEDEHEDDTDIDLIAGDQLAAMLQAVEPVCGALTRVRVCGFQVDPQAMQALGMAHQNLKHLCVDTRCFVHVTQQLFDMLLSSLPVLSHLGLKGLGTHQWSDEDYQQWVINLRSCLASAMARQPPGRLTPIVTHNSLHLP